MKIIVSAKLKDSQIKYKIIPLSLSDLVDEIYLLRKTRGPEIPKVKYIVLPAISRIKIFNILLTPFILAFYTMKLKADLIISYNFLPHGLFAFIASKITGVPFNYSQIDTNTIDIVKKNNLKSKLIRNMIRKAVFINVPGSNSVDFWKSQGVAADRIMTLHSTIDTDGEYYPVSTPKIFDLLYIGVLEPRKQVEIIVEAMAVLRSKYPRVKLAIVGDGSVKNQIVNLINTLELNQNIEMFGHRNDVKTFIHQSKIFVMASRVEGIPCAMMEAMACQVYPVVPDVADIADVVNTSNGTLMPATFSPAELANAIDQILESWQVASSKTSVARQEIVDKHSYISAKKAWDEILSKLSGNDSLRLPRAKSKIKKAS